VKASLWVVSLGAASRNEKGIKKGLNHFHALMYGLKFILEFFFKIVKKWHSSLKWPFHKLIALNLKFYN
jgi:hypothetical protein